jgi:preprotein translocase subunit SecE
VGLTPTISGYVEESKEEVAIVVFVKKELISESELNVIVFLFKSSMSFVIANARMIANTRIVAMPPQL